MFFVLQQTARVCYRTLQIVYIINISKLCPLGKVLLQLSETFRSIGMRENIREEEIMGELTIQKLFLSHYPKIRSQGGVDLNRDGKITGGERLDANGDGKIDVREYWGLFKRGLGHFRKNMLLGAVPILVNEIVDVDGLHNTGKTYVPILNSIGQPAYRFMLNKIDPSPWSTGNAMYRYGNAYKQVGDKAVPFLKKMLVKGKKVRQAKAAIYVLKNIGSKAAANALVGGLIAKAGDELLESSLDSAISSLGAKTYAKLIPLVSSKSYLLAQRAHDILKDYSDNGVPLQVQKKIGAALKLFRPITAKVRKIKLVRKGKGQDGTPSYRIYFSFSKVPTGAKTAVPEVEMYRQGSGRIKRGRARCRVWLANSDSRAEVRFYDAKKKYLGKSKAFDIVRP